MFRSYDYLQVEIYTVEISTADNRLATTLLSLILISAVYTRISV
jgi:hypothetical protein